MKRESASTRYSVVLLMAGIATLAAMGAAERADAASRRDAKREFAQSQPGAPLLAIVSLNQQRVTIYDAEGKMLQSPVSTGATSFETPVGIYSVVQKKEVHQSNVYDDGNMPFMQRITWTGIALHAGALPGHPASHGCVRLPLPFAQRLFGLTDIGFRVVVVRDDILPGEISHSTLFKPNPARREAALAAPRAERASAARSDAASTTRNSPPGSARYLEQLKARAAVLSSQADAATKTAAAAKQAAARKAAEATPATRAVSAAQAGLTRAQALLKAVERQLEAAKSPEAVSRAELAKEKALSNVSDAEAKLEAAKAQAQTRMDAAARAAAESKAADAARDLAVEAAAEASRKTFPVSIFVSRKTQRLYVRQAYYPIFEGPVTIRDADKPIGTYVFTAKQHIDNGADVRWGVVSMYAGNRASEPVAQDPGKRRRAEPRSTEPLPTDLVGAEAALDRIEIPREVVERFADVVLPGSSLIISDEGASLETGKDTDFVVLMSGEPQGGIKTRRREQPRNRDDDDGWGGGRGRGGFFSLFFN